MTARYQFVMTPLDVALADARTQHRHFASAEMAPPAICCRICGALWLTGEAWAEDTGYCPGPGERGLDPVLTQQISVGPIGEEG